MSTSVAQEFPEVAEIAKLTEQIAATRHIGRRNRLMTLRDGLFEAIDAHPERLSILRTLLAHSLAAVRMPTAWRCGWSGTLLEEATWAASALTDMPGEIGEQAKAWLARRANGRLARSERPAERKLAYEPKPAGAPYNAARELIAGALSEGQADVRSLLRRAIRLWPQPHPGDPRASCLGGLPATPQDFAWPAFEGEPLLFLGQINFAELHATISDNPFPKQGLVQFYGDHDEVSGSGPVGGSAVYYFPNVARLRSVAAPIDGFLTLPRCGIDFYETAELPDPRSRAIADLRLSPGENKIYRDLQKRLAALACPNDMPDRQSKLLGWPDAIQYDIGEPLLLQLGWWHDGAEHQYWGPGGLVYFLLDEAAILAGRFEEATMAMQCT